MRALPLTDILGACRIRRAGSPGRRPISSTSSGALSEPCRRHKQLYGRRKGPKLSTLQSKLVEELLPRVLLTPEAGRTPNRYFAPAERVQVWLEIGFGGGEHLAWQAEQHGHAGLIGA